MDQGWNNIHDSGSNVGYYLFTSIWYGFIAPMGVYLDAIDHFIGCNEGGHLDSKTLNSFGGVL